MYEKTYSHRERHTLLGLSSQEYVYTLGQRDKQDTNMNMHTMIGKKVHVWYQTTDTQGTRHTKQYQGKLIGVVEGQFILVEQAGQTTYFKLDIVERLQVKRWPF